MSKNVVIYTRISKDRREQTSLASQERACRAYAADRGWNVIAVEREQGVSAYKRDVKRPALERALRTIELGAANIVIVWKLDRFARSVRDFTALDERLTKVKAEFVSVTDGFDTSTAMGRAMRQIAAVFAELESGIKSERILEWHEERRIQAAPPVGPTPFGYQRVAGELVVVEEEAAEIRKAAAAILEGASIRSISSDWDTRAIGTPWASRERKHWGHRGVKHILVSPTTSGRREIAGVLIEGNWPAILDVATADELRAKLLDPQRRVGPGSDRRWMLAGFAECACGGPIGSKPHVAGPRYFCRTCHKSIAAKLLDDHVSASLLAAVDRPRWEQARRAGRAPAVDTEALGARLREIAGDYAAGRVDREVYEAAKLEQAKVIADAEGTAVELPDVDDLRAAWVELGPEQKLLAVAAFIDRVVLHPASRGERVEISWRA